MIISRRSITMLTLDHLIFGGGQLYCSAAIYVNMYLLYKIFPPSGLIQHTGLSTPLFPNTLVFHWLMNNKTTRKWEKASKKHGENQTDRCKATKKERTERKSVYFCKRKIDLFIG